MAPPGGAPNTPDVSWDGACVAGYAEGPGHATARFADGSLQLDAVFHQGMPQGDSRLTENGRPFFEGRFTEKGPDGIGNIVLETKTKVTAEFRLGTVASILSIKLPDGTGFDGQLDATAQNGRGIIIQSNGDRYDGGINNYKYEGFGAIVYASGIRYEGEWHQGMKHGRGKLFALNGNHVEGKWRENELEGHAITYSSDGKVLIDAIWYAGKRTGFGVTVLQDKGRFEGNWLNGLPEGQGKLIRTDGTVVEGLWHQGCLKHSNQTVAILVDPSSCR